MARTYRFLQPKSHVYLYRCDTSKGITGWRWLSVCNHIWNKYIHFSIDLRETASRDKHISQSPTNHFMYDYLWTVTDGYQPVFMLNRHSGIWTHLEFFLQEFVRLVIQLSVFSLNLHSEHKQVTRFLKHKKTCLSRNQGVTAVYIVFWQVLLPSVRTPSQSRQLIGYQIWSNNLIISWSLNGGRKGAKRFVNETIWFCVLLPRNLCGWCLDLRENSGFNFQI